jgi:hypothetical protein
MSVLKLKGLARAALVALALLAASSQAARAETLFLECTYRFPGGNDAATNNYTIDLAKNTVNNYPATINETAIDWVEERSYSSGTTSTRRCHIDRTRGTLIGQDTTCHPDGTCNTRPWAGAFICTKGRAPATKF